MKMPVRRNICVNAKIFLDSEVSLVANIGGFWASGLDTTN